MTPSVSQSSGCLRLMVRSVRPIPSFPCSSSMSRSCELLLFTIIGPILRRSIPSLYIGCTLEVSLVRRITDLSWRVGDRKLGLCHSPESPCGVTNTSRTGPAQDVSFMLPKCSSTGFRIYLCNVLAVLLGNFQLNTQKCSGKGTEGLRLIKP